MKAIVLDDRTGEATLKLADVPVPRLTLPTEVLIRVISVGLDGTDREIIESKYGVFPAGESILIIGHEVSGVIVEAGEATDLSIGDQVTILVRRPCGDPECRGCRCEQQDYCQSGKYVERGINGAHGSLCEYIKEDARYVVKIPAECAPYAVLIEPQSVIEKAWSQVNLIQQRLAWAARSALILGSGPLGILAALTARKFGLHTTVSSKSDAGSMNAEIVRGSGARFEQMQSNDLAGCLPGEGSGFDVIWECSGYSPYIFEAMKLLSPNGVLIVLGVTPGDKDIMIPADQFNQEIVLKNKCIIGSVNASRNDFVAAMHRLPSIEDAFPGLLARMMRERFRMEEVPALDFSKLEVKAIVDIDWTESTPI